MADAKTSEPHTLVDRLRGIYRIPIRDGLGPVGGDNEEPGSENYTRFHYGKDFSKAPPINMEAAQRIEALELALGQAARHIMGAAGEAQGGEKMWHKSAALRAAAVAGKEAISKAKSLDEAST